MDASSHTRSDVAETFIRKNLHFVNHAQRKHMVAQLRTRSISTAPKCKTSLRPRQQSANHQLGSIMAFPVAERASLLGLPAELRLYIYEYLLDWTDLPGTRPAYTVTGALKVKVNSCRKGFAPNTFAVLRVCKQVNAEAQEVFWKRRPMVISVDEEGAQNCKCDKCVPISSLQGITFWPFVRQLSLNVDVAPIEDYGAHLHRLGVFVEALQFGKHLQRLELTLWDMRLPETMTPASQVEFNANLDNIIKTLAALRICGMVSVVLEGEYCEEDFDWDGKQWLLEEVSTYDQTCDELARTIMPDEN